MCVCGGGLLLFWYQPTGIREAGTGAFDLPEFLCGAISIAGSPASAAVRKVGDLLEETGASF